MADVDLDRLRSLAGHPRNAVRQLREIGAAPRGMFVADPRAINSAKYLLIVAAEAALGICSHLAARKAARSPEDYADCMTVLAENLGDLDEYLTSIGRYLAAEI